MGALLSVILSPSNPCPLRQPTLPSSLTVCSLCLAVTMAEVYSSSGDDGLTTLSSLLPNPVHLGQIADFWKRYDNLADSHDRKMSKHLDDNLDVLLIFVSPPFVFDSIFGCRASPCLLARSYRPDCFLRSTQHSFLSPCRLSPPIRPLKQTIFSV